MCDKLCSNFDKFDFENEVCRECVSTVENGWIEVFKVDDDGFTEPLQRFEYFNEALKCFKEHRAEGEHVHIDIWQVDPEGIPEPMSLLL